MSWLKIPKKGVTIVIVMGMLIFMTVLAGVVLAIISSQARLTNHQFRRTRAYYQLWGAMNVALDDLRTGTVPCAPTCTYNSILPGLGNVDITIEDPDPDNISQVKITVSTEY